MVEHDEIISFSDSDDDMRFLFPKLQTSVALSLPRAETLENASRTAQGSMQSRDERSRAVNVIDGSDEDSDGETDSFGTDVLLFDQIGADDSENEANDSLQFAESLRVKDDDPDVDELLFGDNEELLFNGMTEDEHENSASEGEYNNAKHSSSTFSTARHISNAEIRAILAECDEFMPKLDAMSHSERRSAIRTKLAYIVTSLLGQLVLSTTVDTTKQDLDAEYVDDNSQASSTKDSGCQSLTLHVGPRDTREVRFNQRGLILMPIFLQLRSKRTSKIPRMPQFPSNNSGSGSKRFGALFMNVRHICRILDTSLSPAMILRVIDIVDEALAGNKIITLRFVRRNCITRVHPLI